MPYTKRCASSKSYLEVQRKYNESMKIKEIIKILESDGWYLSRTKGSHRQFKHSIKSSLVTVSGKLSDDIAVGTQTSIFKQAGLKK